MKQTTALYSGINAIEVSMSIVLYHTGVGKKVYALQDRILVLQEL